MTNEQRRRRRWFCKQDQKWRNDFGSSYLLGNRKGLAGLKNKKEINQFTCGSKSNDQSKTDLRDVLRKSGRVVSFPAWAHTVGSLRTLKLTQLSKAVWRELITPFKSLSCETDRPGAACVSNIHMPTNAPQVQTFTPQTDTELESPECLWSRQISVWTKNWCEDGSNLNPKEVPNVWIWSWSSTRIDALWPDITWPISRDLTLRSPSQVRSISNHIFTINTQTQYSRL